MRIGWYDHGQVFQSAAIPDLPPPEETWGVYGPKAREHFKTDVVGMSLWRIPLLHRLIDDGHEICMLTRRKVMPCDEKDQDLQRLAGQYPEFEPLVRYPDPCSEGDQFRSLPIRQNFNVHWVSDRFHFPDSDKPTSEMLEYWVREQVLGPPPELDIFVCAAMRADVATGFETAYLIGTYINRGTPVVIWDQDRQLAGTKSSFTRLGHEWPNPLVTVIGPYEEETKLAKPMTIDYPYVTKYEREPVPVAEREAVRYVGNDYGRRAAMERLLICQAKNGLRVQVWGDYSKGQDWVSKHPEVEWMGRCPPNAVPGIITRAKFAVNVIKDDYVPIGLITLRTFDVNLYGTLQIGDRRVKRLAHYIPDSYLVETTRDALALGKRIASMDDDTYRSELERQREMTRKNDFEAFSTRFYEILDVAYAKRTSERKDFTPMRRLVEPVMKPLDFVGKIDKQGRMVPGTVQKVTANMVQSEAEE